MALLVVACVATEDLSLAFEEFITQHNKQYDAVEKGYRFKVFQSNVRKALLLNADEPSAVYGVTKFADMTEEEYVLGTGSMYLLLLGSTIILVVEISRTNFPTKEFT